MSSEDESKEGCLYASQQELVLPGDDTMQRVGECAWSRDGSTIATAERFTAKLHLWTRQADGTFKHVRTIDTEHECKSAPLLGWPRPTFAGLVFVGATGNEFVVTAGANDHHLKWWKVSSGECTNVVPGPEGARCVACATGGGDWDSAVIAVASADDSEIDELLDTVPHVGVWPANPHKIAAGAEVELEIGSNVTCVAVSPDNSKLAVGSRDGYVRVHRVADKEVLLAWQGRVRKWEDFTRWELPYPVTSCAFTADGKRLLAAWQDDAVQLRGLDGADDEPYKVVASHPRVWCCLGSPAAAGGNGVMATLSTDKVCVWPVTLDAGAEFTWTARSCGLAAACLSPVGDLLLCTEAAKFKHEGEHTYTSFLRILWRVPPARARAHSGGARARAGAGRGDVADNGAPSSGDSDLVESSDNDSDAYVAKQRAKATTPTKKEKKQKKNKKKNKKKKQTKEKRRPATPTKTAQDTIEKLLKVIKNAGSAVSENDLYRALEQGLPSRTSRANAQPGYVYMLRMDDTGLYKVGKAFDVEARIRALQTGNPHELVKVTQGPSSDSDENEDALALEQAIHECLQGVEGLQADLKGGSEWYTLTDTDAATVSCFIQDITSATTVEQLELDQLAEDLGDASSRD